MPAWPRIRDRRRLRFRVATRALPLVRDARPGPMPPRSAARASGVSRDLSGHRVALTALLDRLLLTKLAQEPADLVGADPDPLSDVLRPSPLVGLQVRDDLFATLASRSPAAGSPPLDEVLRGPRLRGALAWPLRAVIAASMAFRSASSSESRSLKALSAVSVAVAIDPPGWGGLSTVDVLEHRRPTRPSSTWTCGCSGFRHSFCGSKTSRSWTPTARSGSGWRSSGWRSRGAPRSVGGLAAVRLGQQPVEGRTL